MTSKLRILTVRNENVLPSDRYVDWDGNTHEILSVYCIFFEKNGPDPHIVVEYRDGNNTNKYGRTLKVQRVVG